MTTKTEDILARAIDACENVDEPQWFGYENPHTFDDGKQACITALWKLAAMPRSEPEGVPSMSRQTQLPKAFLNRIDAAVEALSYVLAFAPISDERQTQVSRALSGLRAIAALAAPPSVPAVSEPSELIAASNKGYAQGLADGKALADPKEVSTDAMNIIAVNLMRIAGLDKHEAREIALRCLRPTDPKASALGEDAARLREALASKNARCQRAHEEAASAFVTYDGSAVDLNEFSRYVRRLEVAVRAAIASTSGEKAEPGCECEACKPQDFDSMRMILCSTCGNKRCPHATDHRNPCTNSNEPGQKGSAWENVQPWGPVKAVAPSTDTGSGKGEGQ